MPAGLMDSYLKIYASTEAAGTARDPKRTFEASPEFTVWARKRSLSAREETVAAARGTSEDVVFEIWAITGLTEQHRILCGGEYYDITGIRESPDGKHAMLHLYASRGRSYGK